MTNKRRTKVRRVTAHVETPGRDLSMTSEGRQVIWRDVEIGDIESCLRKPLNKAQGPLTEIWRHGQDQRNEKAIVDTVVFLFDEVAHRDLGTGRLIIKPEACEPVSYYVKLKRRRTNA